MSKAILLQHVEFEGPGRILPVFRDFGIPLEVRRLYRRIEPDIVHHVSLEPTIIGSLASIRLPVVTLAALTGLGFAFAAPSIKAHALGVLLAPLLRYRLGRRAVAVLVQNPDDRAFIVSLGIAAERIFTIPGSGVDIGELSPLPDVVDFAVVGGGFTGLAAAAWLRHLAPEKRVALFESSRIGAGSSGHTGDAPH